MACFSENRLYYEKTADRFHILRTLAALALAAVMIFTGVMSYGFLVDNQFQYLYKIWKINPVSLGKQYNDISYAAGNGAGFVLYKNDLAIIESGKIAVYDMSGDRRFRAEAPNSAQAFAVSDKYLALYTPGDKRIAIYDSFSSVYEHGFEYPIRLAAISDSGRFALCLREEERTVVQVYNQDSVMEISVTLAENAVIYDLDLSPNGDKLAITTIEGGDAYGAGGYYTDFAIWDVSSDKQLFYERVSGQKPVSTAFFDNTRLYFATEKSVIFCQSSGKKLQTVSDSNHALVACDGKNIAVSDGSSRVIVYSSKGEMKTDFSISEKIIDLQIKNDFCYAFSSKTASVYDEDGRLKSAIAIRSGALDFFVLDDESLLICYVSETKRIVP